MREKTYAIELNDVSFMYKHATKPALDHLTLKIESGEMIGIMGPRGSGKSTLCFALNGVIPHFIAGTLKGEVKVFGEDTKELDVVELSRSISVINQDFGVQPDTETVEQEIAAGLQHLALSADEINERIEKHIRFNELERLKVTKPTELSSGEKQRVIIAAQLAIESPIMCFDEAWFDLNSLSKRTLLEKIGTLHRDYKKTIVIISNAPEELLSVDRILLMRDGRVEKEGPLRDILADSEMLKTYDIPSLPMAEVFPHEKKIPLTVEESIKVVARKHYSFNDKKYQKILCSSPQTKNKEAGTILEFEEVSVTEGDHTILQNITLQIGGGEFIVLAGENGSGKTTFLKLINGLQVPSKGKVLHNGQQVHKVQDGVVNREVAYLPQDAEHHMFMETVRDDVAFGLRFFHVDEKDIEVRVRRALNLLHLGEKANADPLTLTQGERRKIALAQVFVSGAKLFILDEPISLLQPSEVKEVMNVLKHYQKMGCTILMSTQHLSVAAEYAERMIVLKEGEIFLDGSIREIFSQKEALYSCSLALPEVTAFSLAYGKVLLSVDEAKRCLNKV